MDRLPIVVILLFFCYFLSFLTGGPALRVGLTPDEAEELRQMQDTGILFQEAERDQRRNVLGQLEQVNNGEASDPENAELSAYERAQAERRAELEAARSRVKIEMQPGLVELVLVERHMLGRFDDPLLESDSRPEDLLGQMARSLTTDTVQLGINAFWCAQILLCLVALLRRHWFYGPMSTIVVLVSVLMLAFDLVTAQRSAMALYEDKTPQILHAVMNTLLIVLGTGLLLQKLLPAWGRLELSENQFMGHLRPAGRADGSRTGRRALETAFEIVLIMFVGLLVANLLLFPIYKLQLSFPGFFAALLVVGLLVLASFYVRAYLKVAHSQQTDDAKPVRVDSAISFLGFRMLSNTLFLIGAITLVCVIFAVVIILAMYNIVFLQGFELLPTPESL